MTLTIGTAQSLDYRLLVTLQPVHLAGVWPKFHLARLDTTRHVRLCRSSRDERVERVEPCCSNMANDEQTLVFACTSLVVFMLLHTQIPFFRQIKLKK